LQNKSGIGQKWSLVSPQAGRYGGSGLSETTNQRRFVGDCGPSGKQRTTGGRKMESEFMIMAYGIALVFCAVVSMMAVIGE